MHSGCASRQVCVSWAAHQKVGTYKQVAAWKTFPQPASAGAGCEKHSHGTGFCWLLFSSWELLGLSTRYVVSQITFSGSGGNLRDLLETLCPVCPLEDVMGEAHKCPKKKPCKSPRSWLQVFRIVLVGHRSSCSCTYIPGCHRFQTLNANTEKKNTPPG